MTPTESSQEMNANGHAHGARDQSPRKETKPKRGAQAQSPTGARYMGARPNIYGSKAQEISVHSTRGKRFGVEALPQNLQQKRAEPVALKQIQELLV